MGGQAVTARRFGIAAVLALLAAGSRAEGPARKDRLEAAAQARSLMAGKRFDEAAAKWETALAPGAANKDLKQGLPSLGRCYEEAGNFQKALTAYQRALQFDEKEVPRLLDLARVYTRVDLDQEAISLYQHVLKLDPDRRDASLILARLYLKTGRHEDARREGGRYVQWEPRDPAGQRLMAEVEEASGDLRSAARRREVLAAQAPSPQAYFDLGKLWVRAGDWDLAETSFIKAEDLGMRTGTLYLHRGVVKWLRKDAAGAEVLWRRALERHPGMGAAHFFLAVLDKERGGRGLADKARQASAGAQGPLLKTLVKSLEAGSGPKK